MLENISKNIYQKDLQKKIFENISKLNIFGYISHKYPKLCSKYFHKNTKKDSKVIVKIFLKIFLKVFQKNS